jgi:hypothetical protein
MSRYLTWGVTFVKRGTWMTDSREKMFHASRTCDSDANICWNLNNGRTSRFHGGKYIFSYLSYTFHLVTSVLLTTITVKNLNSKFNWNLPKHFLSYNMWPSVRRDTTHTFRYRFICAVQRSDNRRGTAVKISKKHDAQQEAGVLKDQNNPIMSKQFLKLPAVSTQGRAASLQTQISGWKRSNFTEFHNPIR